MQVPAPFGGDQTAERELALAVLPRVSLTTYHDEVAGAVERMAQTLAHDGIPAAVRVLDQQLRGAAAVQVIDSLPEGRSSVLQRVRRELHGSSVRVPSAPGSRVELVRILLLQQVDVAWWAHLEPYLDDAALVSAPELVPLPGPRGASRFRFAVQPRGWVGRGRDYARRRIAPYRQPRTPGMRFPLARPEMVNMLDEVAGALRACAPPGTPPLWVTSMVRNVEYQRHLGALGYPAQLPSSHCFGWAADIEMAWYEHFGAAEALRAVLLSYLDRGVLNVIDEGQAWHVCLSPQAAAGYRHAAARTDRGSR